MSDQRHRRVLDLLAGWANYAASCDPECKCGSTEEYEKIFMLYEKWAAHDGVFTGAQVDDAMDDILALIEAP